MNKKASLTKSNFYGGQFQNQLSQERSIDQTTQLGQTLIIKSPNFSNQKRFNYLNATIGGGFNQNFAMVNGTGGGVGA